MPGTGATPPAGPTSRPDRYGRPRPARRPAVRRLLVAIGLSLAVVATVITWLLTRPGVEVGVTRIDFVSAHRVDVTFEVHKPATATAVCVVRARDGSGRQAGYAEVTVGPSRSSVVTVTHRLPTTSRAATGEVTGCRLAHG